MTGLRLRPVLESDLDAFDRSFQSAAGAGEHQWFGFTPTNRLRAALHERALLGGADNMLSVTAGDELVGRVEWLERRWGRPDTSSCWEIAIGILPEARGQGYGTAAQRMLVAYLFEHTRVERIQATTDPTNIAERTCLDRIGFGLDGTVRRAQWRQGRWHDQLLYSILRPEWPTPATAPPARPSVTQPSATRPLGAGP
jgi:RimJ/RimL family protein N-acetyltransferase